MPQTDKPKYIFLIRANPKFRKNRTNVLKNKCLLDIQTAYEFVDVSSIAWVEPIKIGQRMGSICLMETGEFKTYLQSTIFIKWMGKSVITQCIKNGTTPPYIPWAS